MVRVAGVVERTRQSGGEQNDHCGVDLGVALLDDVALRTYLFSSLPGRLFSEYTYRRSMKESSRNDLAVAKVV